MPPAQLEIRGVTMSFKTYDALGTIDLDVERGEFVALIGHSGCGKSTLLNLIAGLVRPTSGVLRLDGQPIAGPGPDRSMVFQHHALLPWLTVWQNVYVAVDAAVGNRLGPGKLYKREIVANTLRVVGLWEHRNKKPAELSGGMRQRVAIARAFAVEPKVLLLDEPFGALDALTRASLQDELLSIWSGTRAVETVIMVTHDIDEAIYLADRIVVMSNGPRATIREVLPVTIPRPRDRRGMLHLAAYADLKAHIIDLLATGDRRLSA
ncbi:ABC transporter ATP-binding protein [Tepidiforma sp.]|uniref:ABC transporter ATP-binding protein n=1 Tax=Tepidiforma sp. TaxID=2682230 RepID=UPI002ADE30B9|nr:ABC transporter ATP-binding protein [Tepidiforma sp.]